MNSNKDSQFGYHGQEDYDRILGEGQTANDYVDDNIGSQHPIPGNFQEGGMRTSHEEGFGYHGVDDYNKILGEGQDDYKEGEYMQLFQQQASQRKNRQQQHEFGHHGVEDYNKILGEGQDDYAEGEYMNLFEKSQQKEKHLEYPATHLYTNKEAETFPEMNSSAYLNETKDMEIEKNQAAIPGCGMSTRKPQHYNSNNFQAETMLQARKMNEANVPSGSMDTSEPTFEGQGHHTPVPGAGRMQPQSQHNRGFQLEGSAYKISGQEQVPLNAPIHSDEMTYHYNPKTGAQTVPRSETQKKNEEMQQHQNIFGRLKKTISR